MAPSTTQIQASITSIVTIYVVPATAAVSVIALMSGLYGFAEPAALASTIGFPLTNKKPSSSSSSSTTTTTTTTDEPDEPDENDPRLPFVSLIAARNVAMTIPALLFYARGDRQGMGISLVAGAAAGAMTSAVVGV
jgi:hypothetical protein